MKQRLETYFGRPYGFLVIVAYKAIWGVLESFSGVLLIFSFPLITAELMEDPQDRLSNWFIDHVHLSPHATVAVGEFMLFFGLSKILLAIALWYEFRHIRTLGLIFFGGLGAYGVYDLFTTHFSTGSYLSLLADLLIVFYFWKILPKYLKRRG